MHDELIDLDLSDSRVRGYAAGLRPFRRGSPRLEIEQRDGKIIGHNYGHGGSGITMSWGSAGEIVAMLGPHLESQSKVAVLGAGVMGLCTASILQDHGHQVNIYARDFNPHTTSTVAGGLWAPTHVALGQSREENDRHERILRTSWRAFRTLDARHFGIQEAPLFETDDRRYPLDPMPEGLVEPPRHLERLPFRGVALSGLVSRTLLIETPRFLKAMLDQITDRGGHAETLTVTAPSDLQSLPETVIVNCLGLGASAVTTDSSLGPIRGQLVLLDPAPLPFFLDHADGYVISRRDQLILGGTFEEDVADPNPVPEACAAILHKHRKLFNTMAT